MFSFFLCSGAAEFNFPSSSSSSLENPGNTHGFFPSLSSFLFASSFSPPQAVSVARLVPNSCKKKTCLKSDGGRVLFFFTQNNLPALAAAAAAAATFVSLFLFSTSTSTFSCLDRSFFSSFFFPAAKTTH